MTTDARIRPHKARHMSIKSTENTLSGTRCAANARSHGVVIDDMVTIVREKDTSPLAGTNAHASYLSRRYDPNQLVRCEDLFPGGKIAISVHRSVFLSDESVVAHVRTKSTKSRVSRQLWPTPGVS